MRLSELEKEKIKIIDKQVKLLQDDNSSDSKILNTLNDFIADTKCIVENCESDELDLHLRKYNGFAYFLSIVSLAMTA